MNQAPVTADRAGKGAVPVKCSSCEALRQVPFACEDCHQLLAHVQGANYFELFGLPRTYELDLDLLEEKYLAISRNIHPDKFATAGEEMQAFALRACAAVNNAYDVLCDPLHRAEYLLESAGGKSATQDKRVSQDLLTKVMTLREQLEEAKTSGDRAGIEAIRGQATVMKRSADQQIATLCGRLTAGEEQTRDELRLQLNALKYLNNLLAQT
jgi:molecular chaperone HscB